jgi:uncharacterized protein (DUF983 family)
MKTYESADGRKGYDECPQCGSHEFRNSWHGPMFGLQCAGCGMTGTAAQSEDNPLIFMPDDQKVPFHFSVVTAVLENPL